MNEHEQGPVPGYDASPVSVDAARAWIARAGSPLSAFVGGETRPAIDTTAPEHVATSIARLELRVSVSSADQVSAALSSAYRLHPGWRDEGAQTRAEALAACAASLEAHVDLVGVVAAVAASRAIRFVRDYDLPHIVWSLRHASHRVRTPSWAAATHRPRGVCLVLDDGSRAPSRVVLHVAAALATGNAVVWATEPRATACAVAIADLCTNAGLPAGAINVVCAHGEDLAALAATDTVSVVTCLAHDDVATAAARLADDSGTHVVRVTTRPSAMIVLAAADVDSAVESLAQTVAYRAGRSASPTRLLLQEAQADDVMVRFGRRLARLRVGDCLDASVDLVDPAFAAEASASAVESTIAEGSRHVGQTTGGDDAPTRRATMLTDVAPASEPHLDQADGSVVVAATFRTAHEAASLLPAAGVGTSLSIWGEEIGPVLDLARQVPASTVHVNGSAFDQRSAPVPPSLLGDLHPDPTWSYVQSDHDVVVAPGAEGISDTDLAAIWHAWQARAADVAGSARELHATGLVVALPVAVGTIGVIPSHGAPAVAIANLVFAALAAPSRVVVATTATSERALDAIARVLESEGVASGALTAAPMQWNGEAGTEASAAVGALVDRFGADAVWLVGSGPSRHGFVAATAGRLIPVWHTAIAAASDRPAPAGSSAAAPWLDEHEILRHTSHWKVIVL